MFRSRDMAVRDLPFVIVLQLHKLQINIAIDIVKGRQQKDQLRMSMEESRMAF